MGPTSSCRRYRRDRSATGLLLPLGNGATRRAGARGDAGPRRRDPGGLLAEAETALPEVLRDSGVERDPAGEHEEEVREPVQVPEGTVSDAPLVDEREEASLGATAHRPGLMEEGGDRASSRQDE